MTSSAAERIALILDCLPRKESNLETQPRLWRHRDGHYVTEEEAELIDASTPGDMVAAIALRRAELDHLKERNILRDELTELLRRYDRPGDKSVAGIIARMPQPHRQRATEIWNAISPEFYMWCAAGQPDWPE